MKITIAYLKEILPYGIYQSFGLDDYEDPTIHTLDHEGVFENIMQAYHVDIYNLARAGRSGAQFKFTELNKLVQLKKFVDGCYGLIDGDLIGDIELDIIQSLFKEYNGFCNQCITWTYS